MRLEITTHLVMYYYLSTYKVQFKQIFQKIYRRKIHLFESKVQNPV